MDIAKLTTVAPNGAKTVRKNLSAKQAQTQITNHRLQQTEILGVERKHHNADEFVLGETGYKMPEQKISKDILKSLLNTDVSRPTGIGKTKRLELK